MASTACSAELRLAHLNPHSIIAILFLIPFNYSFIFVFYFAQLKRFACLFIYAAWWYLLCCSARL